MQTAEEKADFKKILHNGGNNEKSLSRLFLLNSCKFTSLNIDLT